MSEKDTFSSPAILRNKALGHMDSIEQCLVLDGDRVSMALFMKPECASALQRPAGCHTHTHTL